MSSSRTKFNRLLKLWQERDGRCFYCNKFTFLKKNGNRYFGTKQREVSYKDLATEDHIIPRCRGGTNLYDNLVLSCSDCNTIKADSTGEEFIQIKYDWGCDYKAILRIDQNNRQRKRNEQFLEIQKALNLLTKKKRESNRVQNIYKLFNKKLDKDRL